MSKYLIIILLIFIFLFLIYNYGINTSLKLHKVYVPRIIWVYWEHRNGRTTYPTHIKLCLETFNKYLTKKYNVIFLNEKTIGQYLPDLEENLKKKLNKLLIAQKVDYYRIILLYKYGGIWLDVDTIILRNLDDIFDKLDNSYDFVGFGCSYETCDNGKWRPSNWALASRKSGILMKKCLDILNKKINDKNNEYDYHDLGKIVIWDALENLRKSNYDYYHYSAEYDGTRDENKKWVHVTNHFSRKYTKLLGSNNNQKPFFIFLSNSEIEKYQSWVIDCDRKKLLYGDFWISHLFRKALL